MRLKEIETRLAQIRGELTTRAAELKDEEIAKHIGMDIKKYRKLQRMSVIMNVLSLDMLIDDEDEHQSLQLSSPDNRLRPSAQGGRSSG